MNNTDIKYLITALVDNEIPDEQTRNMVLSKVNSDSSLRYDYLVQQRMKQLVAGAKFYSTPEKIRNKIIKKIKPSGINSSGISGSYRAINPRYWIFSTAAVILVAVLLVLFNRPPLTETTDTIVSKNMFLEAEANFIRIKNGELKPALVSSDPDAINKFFISEGVEYNTSVPLFDDLTLLGAVVSEENGNKLAHHVYTSGNTNLVYVFQVQKSYIEEGSVVSLPDDIAAAIQRTNCYATSSEGMNSVLTVIDNNIFAVVSDLSLRQIESLFCSTKEEVL